MPHIRPHLRSFVLSIVGRGSYVLLALGIVGCGQENKNSPSAPVGAPLEYVQDISPVHRVTTNAKFQMTVAADKLGFRGAGEQQRAVLEHLTVDVRNPAGASLLQLTANNAITLHPYAEISLHGISIQSADATTFEGEELMWPYANRTDRVGLLGPALLVTNDLMVEGDTIVGDLLMGAYEILHVISYIDLQAAPEDSMNTNAEQ